MLYKPVFLPYEWIFFFSAMKSGWICMTDSEILRYQSQSVLELWAHATLKSLAQPRPSSDVTYLFIRNTGPNNSMYPTWPIFSMRFFQSFVHFLRAHLRGHDNLKINSSKWWTQLHFNIGFSGHTNLTQKWCQWLGLYGLKYGYQPQREAKNTFIVLAFFFSDSNVSSEPMKW